MSPSDIDRLLEHLAAPSPVPLNRAVWSARQVAAFLDCSPRHVVERLSNQPDFPPARRMPSRSGRGSLRWKATDILDWWDRQ
jgi:predicted DNA-binding transcriptional regulator AlpA